MSFRNESPNVSMRSRFTISFADALVRACNNHTLFRFCDKVEKMETDLLTSLRYLNDNISTVNIAQRCLICEQATVPVI